MGGEYFVLGAPLSRSVKHHCFCVFWQDVVLNRRKKGMETRLKETDDRLTDESSHVKSMVEMQLKLL